MRLPRRPDSDEERGESWADLLRRYRTATPRESKLAAYKRDATRRQAEAAPETLLAEFAAAVRATLQTPDPRPGKSHVERG